MAHNLTLPKGRYTQAKLRAYKRHWAAIARLQDEFNSQWIHQGQKDGKVAHASQLSPSTVQRFRQWGRGASCTSYSYFHGPAATTIFGIADALDLELTLQPKKRNGRHG